MTINTAHGTVIHDIVIGDIDDFERTFRDALRRSRRRGAIVLPTVAEGRCQICEAARISRAAHEAGEAAKAAVDAQQARRDAAAAAAAGAKWGSLHPARLVGSLVVDSSAEYRRAADVVEKLTGDATSSVSATDLREEADGMDAAETLARRRNDAITRVGSEFRVGEVTAAAIVALVTDVMDGVTR